MNTMLPCCPHHSSASCSFEAVVHHCYTAATALPRKTACHQVTVQAFTAASDFTVPLYSSEMVSQALQTVASGKHAVMQSGVKQGHTMYMLMTAYRCPQHQIRCSGWTRLLCSVFAKLHLYSADVDLLLLLQLGNFRVEPPGLFRGRGEHPKMGRVKTRIYPRDIVINIGRCCLQRRLMHILMCISMMAITQCSKACA